MTRLALGGKCGPERAWPFAALGRSSPSAPSIDASAIPPRPPPLRQRNSRRDGATAGFALGPGHEQRFLRIVESRFLIDEQELVAVEDHAASVGHPERLCILDDRRGLVGRWRTAKGQFVHL